MTQQWIVTVIFFLSGFAGLIYQVVWQRVLTLYYGVGPVSIVIIVSVYMLGLGLGSLLGGLWVEKVKGKWGLYCGIEALLGLFGFASLDVIGLIGRHTAGCSLSMSLFYISLFLVVPTLLMGMTLPVLVKLYTPLCANYLYSLSRLYFINTLGAAAGALTASYGIITYLGMDRGVMIAAFLNLFLAMAVLLIQKPIKHSESTGQSPSQPGKPFTKIACILVSLAGFLAIGYEVIWYRLIGVLIKDSPYAFSSILAVYLLGIALGSYGVRSFQNRTDQEKREIYYKLQGLLSLSVLVIIAGYFYLTRFTGLEHFTRLSFANDLHPAPPSQHWNEGLQGIYAMMDVFLWPLFFMLIPTLCMGASLPLVSSLALSDQDEGKTTGLIYFFNTLGNVAGGLITGFFLIPLLGTERVLLLFIATGLTFCLFIKSVHGTPFPPVIRGICFASTVTIAILIFPARGELYKVMHTDPFDGSECYFQEGLDSVVLTYRQKEKVRNFINGQGHGYRPGHLFYAESGEALRYAKSADKVLIIGFGAGSILELVLKSQSVRHVTVVELCESSILNLKKIPLYRRMLSDPRVCLVMDDGRRLLSRSEERYDLILMDPSRTTTAYSNNLNSLEFFTLARSRLTKNGVLMAGGITSGQAFITRTLAQAFPFVRNYGFFCLCSCQNFQQNQAISDEVAKALPSQIQNHISALIRYQGNQDQILEKTRSYPVNTDLRPYAEYYLRSAWPWDER